MKIPSAWLCISLQSAVSSAWVSNSAGKKQCALFFRVRPSVLIPSTLRATPECCAGAEFREGMYLAFWAASSANSGVRDMPSLRCSRTVRLYSPFSRMEPRGFRSSRTSDSAIPAPLGQGCVLQASGYLKTSYADRVAPARHGAKVAAITLTVPKIDP